MCRNLDIRFLLFYYLLSKIFFPPLFVFFLSVLLSFLFLSNWFFLSSFIFFLLFRHCFIPVSLVHVFSSLVYPNLLGTKRLGCCCLSSSLLLVIYRVYLSSLARYRLSIQFIAFLILINFCDVVVIIFFVCFRNSARHAEETKLCMEPNQFALIYFMVDFKLL
jgi:hypothetical protein